MKEMNVPGKRTKKGSDELLACSYQENSDFESDSHEADSETESESQPT